MGPDRQGEGRKMQPADSVRFFGSAAGGRRFMATFRGKQEVTGVPGVLQTPFRPRIGFVPPGLVLLVEASRACPPVFLGEDRSLKVPHRTRTGVVIHADRR
ncbi:MAG: hypothetical protein CMJ67_04455 [Planctomycetaceae bacterium]|nr:hypothetical protein [Planctomycetaceae bacterium]